MAGNNRQTQTSTQGVDPGTRAYIEQYRQKAAAMPGYQTGLGGLEAYTDPYQAQVIESMRGEFGRQREGANMAAGDMATRAGAYGGSREAVLRAQMMGDVNRNEASTIAGLQSSGYSDAVNRMMQDRMNQYNVGFGNLSAMQPGFTPTSQTGTQTMTQSQSLWPQLLGAGLGIGGMLLGGPAGAAAGSALGGSIMNPQGRVAQGGGLNFGGFGSGNMGFGGGYQPSVQNPWQYDPYMGQGGW